MLHRVHFMINVLANIMADWNKNKKIEEFLMKQFFVDE